MNLLQEVIDKKEYTVNLRRYFHMHPEPSGEEYNTAVKIEEELDKLNIPHKRIGETGVYAWIKGLKGEGKIIAVRADTDALRIVEAQDREYCSLTKGYMHACGHDAHTAALLSTVACLKEHESEFAGEIRIFFQQSEENGQGARQFVNAGLLENVERVIGYHCAAGIDCGKVSCTPGANNASCDYFKITIKGKAAHVSKPHLGIDAAYIASSIVVSLQSIVARTLDPLDTVVVGVGKMTVGTTYNIVAGEAVIEGTTRCFSNETREHVNGLVKKIAQDTAATYGAEAIVQIDNYANPLINDPVVSKECEEVVESIVGKENTVTNRVKELGADDFADYLQVVPGCYLFVGSCNPDNPNTGVAHHNEKFDVDEEHMLIASSVMVAYVKKFFGI